MISLYQKISENFIQEFKNKINWALLIENQRIKLSINFIKKNVKSMNILCFKYHLSKNIKNFIIKKYRKRKVKTIRSLKLDRNLCNLIVGYYQR